MNYFGINELFLKDIELQVKSESIPWEKMRCANIFISGATGIIGYAIILLLLKADELFGLDLRITALTRNPQKARQLFSCLDDCVFDSKVYWLQGDVLSFPNVVDTDYVINGAAMTSSSDFINKPVETILTAFKSTEETLNKYGERAKGYVYLSSMEVYGYPIKGHKVVENDIGTFAPIIMRNSYPISKLACENLCLSYAHEYNKSINVVRLTQTIGPVIKHDDNRFFAYIGNCIRNSEEIVLHTEGKTERSYLYSVDAASAIITVLLNGKVGEVYNAADEKLYCSIYEFAKKVAEKNNIGFRIEAGLNYDNNRGYADTLYMDLDTSRLKRLGWKPIGLKLEDIYDRIL